MKKKFYAGIGIENCWMAQTDRPGTRVLDVFEQMRHYEKWKEDLKLARDLGVNAIRYSVPWYKSHPAPGKYDWDWIAAPLDWLVENGITPIIDLIHYGTPTWMENGILDSRFPPQFAEYAYAFAKRFNGIVDHYTPMNEPQASARKSGEDGVWPPYWTEAGGWCQLSLALAKAIVLASRALRDAASATCLISAECNSKSIYKILAPAADLPNLNLGSALFHRLFPASLSYGKILPDDPLVQVLNRLGYDDNDFSWFLENAEIPDIVGYNYYPNLEIITPVEAREMLYRELNEVQSGLGRPIYLAETSAGLTDIKKMQWIRQLRELNALAQKQKFPLCGINWWPLFETIQWSYRDNGKPAEECIVPGGWNNGLYLIDKTPGGSLERIPTDAVAEYRSLCAALLGNDD